MKTLGMLAGSVTILVLSACASINVRTDYDDEVSFGEFRTYEWVGAARGDGGDLGFDSPLMARRVQRSIHAELASMGYERVMASTADFRISYRMVARDDVDNSSGYYRPYGYGGFGHDRHRGYGSGGYGTYARDVVRCVLVLDVWDTRSEQLAWRGWAIWLLDEDPSPETVRKHIDKAIHRILSEFPPEGARGPAAAVAARRPAPAYSAGSRPAPVSHARTHPIRALGALSVPLAGLARPGSALNPAPAGHSHRHA